MLLNFGWDSDAVRLEDACSWLMRFDLVKWYQLEKAGEPKEWDGMGHFTSDE